MGLLHCPVHLSCWCCSLCCHGGAALLPSQLQKIRTHHYLRRVSGYSFGVDVYALYFCRSWPAYAHSQRHASSFTKLCHVLGHSCLKRLLIAKHHYRMGHPVSRALRRGSAKVD